MSEPNEELVVVQVRTRHPEHYLLTNLADGTRWRIVDGDWSQAELQGPTSDGERRYDVGPIERGTGDDQTGGSASSDERSQ